MNPDRTPEAPRSDAETPAPPPMRPRPPAWLERAQRFPVTYAIIALTALVFAGQTLSEMLIGGDLFLALGIKANEAILGGQLWRFFTPILLHIGLIHFLVNMYSLHIIGPPVERFFGHPRLGLVYLLSGVGGVAFSFAFVDNPSAGASGAIFGLLGALAVFLYLHRQVFGQAGALQLRQIVFVALLNLAIGLSPQIDNWGHFGGLLTGGIIAAILGPRYEPTVGAQGMLHVTDQRPWREVWPRALVAAGGVAALCFAAGLSRLNL